MATHSSFLSGESPWAEEPGVLQSIAHRELDPTDATIHTCLGLLMSFPGGSDDKESACNAGDLGVTPASGRCPGEGDGNQLQYSCMENSIGSRAWRATVHGVAKS